MEEKVLPIGTVVLLKGANKKLMIIGYDAAIETDKGKERADYISCRVPEGKVDKTTLRFFNKENIDKIIRMGYMDEEWNILKEKLSQNIN